MKYKILLQRWVNGRVVRQNLKVKDEDGVLERVEYLTHPLRGERLIRCTIIPDRDGHDKDDGS
jgi:hypothetical protein